MLGFKFSCKSDFKIVKSYSHTYIKYLTFKLTIDGYKKYSSRFRFLQTFCLTNKIRFQPSRNFSLTKISDSTVLDGGTDPVVAHLTAD